VIGTLQAIEAVKRILDRGETLIGRLLLFNALEMVFREMRLRENPGCAVCGENPTIGAPEQQRELCPAPGSGAPPTPEGADPFNITVQELSALLGEGPSPLILDVRTPGEWSICRLPGATLVPLHEISARLDESRREIPIVVYCHVGVRSALAVNILRRHGFSRARNLSGGIDAWAVQVDPSVPRY
jgi:adenylyltransferase/sulfurtransferase